MHFVTYVPATIPKIEADMEENSRVNELIGLCEQILKKNPDSITGKIYLEHYRGMQTEFDRAVYSTVSDIMEPFSENTEDPKYLDFYDETESLREKYEHEKQDCVRLPDGSIANLHAYPLSNRFEIVDGKVYQMNYGQIKSRHRSKKAKKMLALPAYPLKKRYKTFSDYANSVSYYCPEKEAYGFYSNPNSFYDWYVIGGRWPDAFLVKEECKEYAIGDRNMDYKDPAAPKGYKWAAAARKKDIAWDAMRLWARECASKRFVELERSFYEDDSSDLGFAHITEEGIVGFSGLLYVAGETLEAYLQRQVFGDAQKYGVAPYGFLSDDGFDYNDSYYDDDIKKQAWHKKVEQYIDALDDETVIVSVDCHE